MQALRRARLVALGRRARVGLRAAQVEDDAWGVVRRGLGRVRARVRVRVRDRRRGSGRVRGGGKALEKPETAVSSTSASAMWAKVSSSSALVAPG